MGYDVLYIVLGVLIALGAALATAFTPVHTTSVYSSVPPPLDRKTPSIEGELRADVTNERELSIAVPLEARNLTLQGASATSATITEVQREVVRVLMPEYPWSSCFKAPEELGQSQVRTAVWDPTHERLFVLFVPLNQPWLVRSSFTDRQGQHWSPGPHVHTGTSDVTVLVATVTSEDVVVVVNTRHLSSAVVYKVGEQRVTHLAGSTYLSHVHVVSTSPTDVIVVGLDTESWRWKWWCSHNQGVSFGGAWTLSLRAELPEPSCLLPHSVQGHAWFVFGAQQTNNLHVYELSDVGYSQRHIHPLEHKVRYVTGWKDHRTHQTHLACVHEDQRIRWWSFSAEHGLTLLSQSSGMFSGVNHQFARIHAHSPGGSQTWVVYTHSQGIDVFQPSQAEAVGKVEWTLPRDGEAVNPVVVDTDDGLAVLGVDPSSNQAAVHYVLTSVRVRWSNSENAHRSTSIMN